MRVSNSMGIFMSSQFAAISASQDFIGFPYEFPLETPRNFTTLSAAGSMYFPFIDDLVFPSAFEHEFKIQTSTTGTLKTILGDNPTAHNIVIRTDGKISITGATTVIFNTDVTDGQLHTFKITRVGTAIEGFLDGVSDGTGNISGGITFSRLGASLADFFNGVIADVKLLGGEINGVPTPVLYTIDEDWVSSTVLNNNATIGGLGDATAVNITASESEPFDFIGGDWLGVELWVDPPSTIGTQWVDNGGGNYTYTGDGSFNQLRADSILVTGLSYRSVFDVIDISGTMRIRMGGVSNESLFSSTGATSVTLLSDGIAQFFSRDVGVVSCELEEISTKRILEVAP